jgi:hypothetical protein
MHNIEMLRRQALPQLDNRGRPERRQLELFRRRALGERTANRANDQLTMIPPPKASRQRQQ